MAIAESILFQINSSNYTGNIATIYKPAAGYSGFITTLRLTINIKSIEEANFPYIPDDTSPDVLQQILDEVALNTEFREIILYVKKGSGAWIERAPIRIFNKEPYYDVNLMRFFSDSNTIDVAEDLSLGIQIKIGNVLTAADTILVWGSVVAEKKNNGNEELGDRLSAIENLLSTFGAPSASLPGSNGLVPAPPAGGGEYLLRGDRGWENPAKFATPAQITTAINALVGNATPETLNTLQELATAFGNDPNFATTVINVLALKASVNSPVFTGNLTSSGTIIPAANPSLAWGIDFTTGASTITLLSGATYDLATGSGMVVLYDNIDGGFNFLFASAGTVVSVASAIGSIVAGSPPSDKVGLFYNPPTLKYRISNNRSSTRTLIISSFRMRSVS